MFLGLVNPGGGLSEMIAEKSQWYKGAWVTRAIEQFAENTEYIYFSIIYIDLPALVEITHTGGIHCPFLWGSWLVY